MYRIYFIILLSSLFISCDNNNNYGTIEIFYNYVPNVKIEDFDLDVYKISNIYFKGNKAIEVAKIKDEYFFNLINPRKNKISKPSLNLDNLSYNSELVDFNDRELGFMPLKDINGYNERINLNDTILDDVKVKRFITDTDDEYTVFYVADNLNLPISFSKKIDKDYKGSLIRIDAYLKKTHEFVTYKVMFKKELPKDMFEVLNKL